MQNWYDMLNFVQQIINSFPISPTHTRFGLVRFSSKAVYDFGFSRYTNSPDLINAVQGLVMAGGETNLSGAFWLANQQLVPGRRPNVKCIVILITDGQPNLDVDTTFININNTKVFGCEIFAIGITNQVLMNFLLLLNQILISKSLISIHRSVHCKAIFA
jgi:secreted protein with Ig-like and vWFA domain